MPPRAPAPLLAERLLAWYHRAARELPWRSAPSPYHVLLSELMLQQTRVETVKPYFARFVARWPTLEDLAAAAPDDVLREWAGLGYYSRARNLHRCAREAVAAGGLPSDPAELRALPGIGPYTAGAVASIAFGQRSAAVDGNVERVLSRVDGREADPRSAAGRRALWARAESLLPDDRPGDLNQALMELGATVCTPRNPSCAACPWGEVCVARATGREETLPNKPKKRPPKRVRGVAGALVRGGRVLMGRRPASGLLGGLWEPVGADLPDGVEPAEHLAHAFSERAGVQVAVGGLLGEVVHVFTHRRLTLSVYRVSAADEPSCGRFYQALRWVDPADPDVPLSALAHKALAVIHEVPVAAELPFPPRSRSATAAPPEE